MRIFRLMLGLAALAVLTFEFADAAYSYSDEAVKDAEELVKRTILRFQVSEVGGADLALTRYYLVEMKYKAGRISQMTYCKLAKPLLQTIVGGFDKDVLVREAMLQGEIAAMNLSRSNCKLASDTITGVLFEAADHKLTKEAVKSAEEKINEITEKFGRGEVTKADVARVQHDLLEIKYGVGQINSKTYCYSDLPLLQSIKREVDEEALVGQATLQELISAKRNFFKIKALCKES